MYSIYSDPKLINVVDKKKCQRVADILHIDSDKLYNNLISNRRFVWVRRYVPEDELEQIRNKAEDWFGFIKEEKRIYPNGKLASHVIGCVNIDGEGIEGLEVFCDQKLRGKEGWVRVLKDSKRRFLHGLEQKRPAMNGCSLVTSIDSVVQHIVERELAVTVEKYNAKSGNVIVMNPQTGEILALANYPSYDPNEYNRSNKDDMRNRAVCDIYEPGSCFKIIAASGVLEEKLADEKQMFFCENGALKISGTTLHDHKPLGELSFEDIIVKSSNIGAYKIASLLGEKRLYEYIDRFGFGKKTGIDLPGEASGILRPVNTWKPIDLGTIPMGHGVGVTAIQMASAVSVIANGGFLIKPKILLRIEDGLGNYINSFEEVEIKNRVISQDTASRVRKILTEVVKRGTGKQAQIKGISVAGKTGTAQKLEANGRYSHSKYIASFVGFAPAENPSYVIVVTIDEPWPVYYGGSVSAPLFKTIMEQILEYYGEKSEAKAQIQTASN